MKALLLMLVALILFTVFAPFGILTILVMLFIVDSRERFIKLADYPYGIAHSIDVLGNVICGDLFNVTMIKHGGYLFGRRGETISSVLGKNMLADNLLGMGIIVSKILDRIDNNHCIKSIQHFD